jgi:hypothetical protein
MQVPVCFFTLVRSVLDFFPPPNHPVKHSFQSVSPDTVQFLPAFIIFGEDEAAVLTSR